MHAGGSAGRARHRRQAGQLRVDWLRRRPPPPGAVRRVLHLPWSPAKQRVGEPAERVLLPRCCVPSRAALAAAPGAPQAVCRQADRYAECHCWPCCAPAQGPEYPFPVQTQNVPANESECAFDLRLLRVAIAAVCMQRTASSPGTRHAGTQRDQHRPAKMDTCQHI